MKKESVYQLVIVSFLLVQFYTLTAQKLPYGFPDTPRTKLKINQGWKFFLGAPEAKNYQTNLDDSQWETVNVPHTLKLTSLTLDNLNDEKTQLVFHRKVGWYRKRIKISPSNTKVFLEFEGAHQVTDLWVNGKHVGQHAIGGYTPFHFDITDFVQKGKENQITLLVDNRRNKLIPPDPGPFDYVKFSGLYRDVYLVETHPVHVTFNWETLNSGVNITTPTIDFVNKNATINVKTAVKNEAKHNAQCKLITRIIDRKGEVVLKLIKEATIVPGQEYQFNQIGSLEDEVHLWDIDDPYLYRVNSVVSLNNKAIDFVETKIGLRKFELDPSKGFLLNGKPIKLIGANRHQHYPYIGDAVPNSLHFKDVLQFKEYGFNVLRTAHYPQDNALLEACDALGILVYEEAPTWVSISDEELWWNNLEQATRRMIRNHRNHASVIMWGAGVNHRGYVPRIHNTVKQEDPFRLTASQSARWTGWQSSGLTDVFANMLYGPFIWDRSEPIFAMEGRRGPKAVAPYKKDPLMTGLISWTAHAYYTFHPTHTKAKNKRDKTRSGMMTIFRYPRPNLSWYKSELLPTPFVDIQEDWEPQTQEITVHSNANKVGLYVNGELLEQLGPSKDSVYEGLDHPPFHFKNINYKPGKIEARATFNTGTVLKEQKHTAGKPYAIQLKLDTIGRKFKANGTDIVMAYATIVDNKGTVVANTDHLVEFTVQGDASVVGDGVGINANPMFTEYGVAPALIRAGNTVGEITVMAKCKGLKSGVAKVRTTTFSNHIIATKAQPIFDFKKERVDLGATDQLVQFGWNPWYENKENSYKFKAFNKAVVKIQKGSKAGVHRWLGEMNVIGKYGYAYGDGIIAIDDKGVNLVFENLPKGRYQLKTWHHAPRSNSDVMDPNREKLKSATIHKLPYETTLNVSSESFIGLKKKQIKVTEGKQMQYELPGFNKVEFASDGEHKVVINFKGVGEKGIWLNALELSEWTTFVDSSKQ